jgi:hypothetical protein
VEQPNHHVGQPALTCLVDEQWQEVRVSQSGSQLLAVSPGGRRRHAHEAAGVAHPLLLAVVPLPLVLLLLLWLLLHIIALVPPLPIPAAPTLLEPILVAAALLEFVGLGRPVIHQVERILLQAPRVGAASWAGARLQPRRTSSLWKKLNTAFPGPWYRLPTTTAPGVHRNRCGGEHASGPRTCILLVLCLCPIRGLAKFVGLSERSERDIL